MGVLLTKSTFILQDKVDAKNDSVSIGKVVNGKTVTMRFHPSHYLKTSKDFLQEVKIKNN